MPNYSVQVTWLDTGDVFPSFMEAAKHMYVSDRSLSRVFKKGGNEICGMKVTFKVVPRKQRTRPVRNLTTGETFPSIKAAVEACGGNCQGLCTALKEQRRYRGVWWRYASKKPF